MAFSTSKFAAAFQSLILDGIQTVLERDLNTALAAIDATLPTFAADSSYRTPLALALNFPALYVEPAASKLQQSGDDSHILEEHELMIGVSIVSNDADALKTLIVQYVLAIDQVLRTMSVTDLTGGVTSARGQPVWEVTEHSYSALRQKDTIYRRNAELILTIQLMER